MYINTKIKHISGRSGFTLVETLVAVAIGVMVALFVIMIATDTLTTTRDIKNSERLHVDVMHMTSKMSYLIKQSRRIESDNPSGFTLFILRYADDGTLLGEDEVEIKHENSRILIDGENITAEDMEVKSFEVKKVENSVRMVFNVKYSGGGREYDFVTTLSGRN